MYNVAGYPRVVLEMKGGRKAVVFSTKNPDAVMDVVKKHIVDSK